MIFKTTRQFKEWWLENVNEYPYCGICKKTNAQVWDCDHIIPRGRLFDQKKLWDRENLLLVCRTCHINKNLLKKEYDKIKDDRNLWEFIKPAEYV